jgi:hypothetical protein
MGLVVVWWKEAGVQINAMTAAAQTTVVWQKEAGVRSMGLVVVWW